MLTKLLSIATFVAFFALAGLGYLLRQAWVANGEQGAQIEALQESAKLAARARLHNQAVSGRLQVRKAAVARSEALAGQDLGSALRANRAWADQPVPDEVQNALR